MQDLLAFNCLTWLFVNEKPVVSYPIEDITVSRAWMVHIPACSCEDGRTRFQLASNLTLAVFANTGSRNTEV